jgi:hypothetical protein
MTRMPCVPSGYSAQRLASGRSDGCFRPQARERELRARGTPNWLVGAQARSQHREGGLSGIVYRSLAYLPLEVCAQ